jgi:plasmid stabilization system protein ParE
MRVRYTPRAARDLDAILSYMFDQNRLAAVALAGTIDNAVGRVAAFPESAPRVAFGEGIRMLTLSRFPYRIFYRIRPDRIEILHMRHTSRAVWEGGR